MRIRMMIHQHPPKLFIVYAPLSVRFKPFSVWRVAYSIIYDSGKNVLLKNEESSICPMNIINLKAARILLSFGVKA